VLRRISGSKDDSSLLAVRSLLSSDLKDLTKNASIHKIRVCIGVK
jgi:hypothetical protein